MHYIYAVDQVLRGSRGKQLTLWVEKKKKKKIVGMVSNSHEEGVFLVQLSYEGRKHVFYHICPVILTGIQLLIGDIPQLSLPHRPQSGAETINQ